MKKELIDQSAHFTIGLVATLLLSMIMPIYAAAPLVLLAAWCREVYQRLMKGHHWFDCKSGCRLDMLFWTLGILTASIIRVI